jgi:hypothetical protein
VCFSVVKSRKNRVSELRNSPSLKRGQKSKKKDGQLRQEKKHKPWKREVVMVKNKKATNRSIAVAH